MSYKKDLLALPRKIVIFLNLSFCYRILINTKSIHSCQESAVLSAEAHSLLEDDQPYFLAIKVHFASINTKYFSSIRFERFLFMHFQVYKTTLTDFKNRGEYVVNDFRFKNPRRVMRIWAEKEFMNLTRSVTGPFPPIIWLYRMFNKQLPCPEPIKLRKHIMVNDFVYFYFYPF